MKILIIVAEVAPFSHVGGLAHGTRYLSKALAELGHDVRIITPMHGCVLEYFDHNHQKHPAKISLNVAAPNPAHTKKNQQPSFSKIQAGKNNVLTYLIDYPDYFSLCSRIYGYSDDHKRFYLFSQLSLELIKKLAQEQWIPDIIQCHDWHTGYLVEMIKNDKKLAKIIRQIPLLFTVHNFRYQGNGSFLHMEKKDLDMATVPLAEINSPTLKEQNALSRGIFYADYVNTVSPTHAQEVQSEEYSYNLERMIKKTKSKLGGILNGLDYDAYDPSDKTSIKYPYTLDNFYQQKQKNKSYLQSLFSLPKSDGLMFAYVGRMNFQKGLDSLVSAMTRILQENPAAQLIGLGGGEEYYCELFWQLKLKFPQQVAVKLEHDIKLPKPIFAGSDITLVPSNFEPGGIVVLEALRYGSVPIVRRTGGMNDVIVDYSPATKLGNGFSFTKQDSKIFYAKIKAALRLYEKKEEWQKLVVNCMDYRRTWKQSAEEYTTLFKKMIAKNEKN